MQRSFHRQMKILLVDELASRKRVAKILLDESMYIDQEKSAAGGDQGAGNLQDCSYKIYEASSNNQALDLINVHHPDLVLVANRRGVVDGPALCERIRTEPLERRTGVIFLDSDDGHKMGSVACLELGADDYLPAEITPRELIARVNAVLRLKALTDELRAANHRLEILSLTDDLTGLHNMRSFNNYYEDHIRRVSEGESGLVVVMMDLDHFKKINDSANHLVGSYIIAEVGKLIKYCGLFPPETCSARYGGDEYVICSLTSDFEAMMGATEKLRQMIAEAEFQKDSHVIKVTASIGVSWIGPYYAGPVEDPIKMADIMLYQSKHNGRNRVEGHELGALDLLADIRQQLGDPARVASDSIILQSIKLYKSA